MPRTNNDLQSTAFYVDSGFSMQKTLENELPNGAAKTATMSACQQLCADNPDCGGYAVEAPLTWKAEGRWVSGVSDTARVAMKDLQAAKAWADQYNFPVFVFNSDGSFTGLSVFGGDVRGDGVTMTGAYQVYRGSRVAPVDDRADNFNCRLLNREPLQGNVRRQDPFGSDLTAVGVEADKDTMNDGFDMKRSFDPSKAAATYSAGSVETCKSLCVADNKCKGFTFDAGLCHLTHDDSPASLRLVFSPAEQAKTGVRVPTGMYAQLNKSAITQYPINTCKPAKLPTGDWYSYQNTPWVRHPEELPKYMEDCCAGKYMNIDGTLDTMTCKRDWCPWSKTCDKSQSVRRYCAQERGGLPNIKNDPNCAAWCTANPDECDAIKEAFCNRPENSKKKVCSCLVPRSDPDFDEFIRTTTRVSNANLGPPPCWWPGCSEDSFRTQRLLKEALNCPDNKSVICAQLITVDRSSAVAIKNNTFKQVCGQDLPSHTKTDPVPLTPGQSTAAVPAKPAEDGNSTDSVVDLTKEEGPKGAGQLDLDLLREGKLVDAWKKLDKQHQMEYGGAMALLVLLLVVWVRMLKRGSAAE